MDIPLTSGRSQILGERQEDPGGRGRLELYQGYPQADHRHRGRSSCPLGAQDTETVRPFRHSDNPVADGK